MIQLRSLTFSRTDKRLVENATLQIHAGWKVGVTGANGCGKSTLFALLHGDHHPDHGDLEWPVTWRIAHVAQETPAVDTPAIEYVLDGNTELRRLERALAETERAHDGIRIAELHEALAAIDGYAARARAAEILDGLGFSPAAQQRPVATFSGGWRMRLNLARALAADAELLLLDEPTNHLDLDAVLWLETWLQRSPATLLVISHDRELLDTVATHILSFENGTLRLYTGNFTTFERTRAEQLAHQQALYEKQQREIAHLRAFVERFRAKATKARQAQSRLKALARMELIEAAHVDSPFTFRFLPPEGTSDPLLTLEAAAVGYDGKPLLTDIDLTIRPDTQLALLGPNGAGKSTLIKLLAGELPLLAGKRTEGRKLKIGYFAQHQMERLRPHETPLQHLIRLEPTTPEQELRDFLGRFDFRGTAADTPCRAFSGGEKARLALALLLRTRPNLLLLDEPTNHLDLEMRDALTRALQEAEVAVVLVSHDRYLLRATADTFVLVADGRVAPFDGDLDDYANWLAQRRQTHRAPTVADRSAKAQRIADRAAQKAAQAEQRRLEKAAAKWEAEIETLTAALHAVEARLADPALYSDRAAADAVAREADALRAQIAEAETQWLEAQTALEALTLASE
ncbi:ATP-binding cassette domain-containing protein [Hydrogenophilus thermoluteolus]|uniref:Probable ATP-binding protein YheS n=1 Tax=Hydrogenophilus thermoluteolus TaxID=297 RepID=A0A2Z6DZ55_HYDTE|nr:ATP-binding cassette domain-containing protein [Hydrogenophilus thermoluteolus]BBD77572.1 ABC transporter, ATP-binding component [Hydrogenophilus thermoluteolus]